MQLHVAGNQVDVHEAAAWLVNKYPAQTVRYYDHGAPSIRDAVTVCDIGRMVPFGARLSYRQAVGFLARGDDATWPNPGESLVLDQDPMMPPEQFVQTVAFETATTLFSTLLGSGHSVAQTSKLLHIKWPGFFPIIDSALRAVYGERAVVLYNDLLRTGRRRSAAHRLGAPPYWLAVREDLCLGGNRHGLQVLRQEIETVPITIEDPDGGHRDRLLGLQPLRLLDMITWGLGTGRLVQASLT